MGRLMTTDQPSNTTTIQTVDHDILRLLIREAVERQIAAELGPLRMQVQVQDGTLKQYNRDITQLMLQCGDLDELVRGNPKQNVIGLADQIKANNALLSSLELKIQTTSDMVEKKVLAEVAKTAQQLDDVKKKQDEATKTREALLNQARGARYAFYALAIVTGLPALDTIGKIFHILP